MQISKNRGNAAKTRFLGNDPRKTVYFEQAVGEPN